jgi:hypothetical protein
METQLAPLSTSELAELAGATEAEIDRMVGLDILVQRDRARPFLASDVQKVRLARACEQAGLPMEGIASAITAGRLSFAFLEASPFRRWAVRSARPYRQVSQEAGVPLELLRAALASMGFASVAPDKRIREDELEIVPLLQLGHASGVLDQAWMTRVGRTFAEGLRLVAKAENEAYHARFEMPMLEAGLISGRPWSWPPGWVATSTRWWIARCWPCTAGSRNWRGPSTWSSTSRPRWSRPASSGGLGGSRRCASSTWWATRG